MPGGMKPYGTTTYQYKTTDSPLTVAQQFNLHPNQLAAANPGGFPAVPGQVINIPSPYNAYGTMPTQTNPGYAPYGVQGTTKSGLDLGGVYQNIKNFFNPTPGRNVTGGFTNQNTPAQPPALQPQPYNAARAQGADAARYNAQGQFYTNLVESIARDPASYNTLAPNLRDSVDRMLGGGSNQGGGGNSDFMNTKFMQEYQAKGTSFYNQQRWDPKEGKFRRIGDLIHEGRLNMQTGKLYNHGYGNRKHGGGRNRKPTKGGATTLGVVDFNASSG